VNSIAAKQTAEAHRIGGLPLTVHDKVIATLSRQASKPLSL
jgi:hypothetical protein